MIQDYYFYMLLCNDDSYYIGHTDDLEKRVSEHQNKVFCNYTSDRLPVQLVFSQRYDSRQEAFEMERKIKKWSRAKKEALINGDFQKLVALSKKKFVKT